MGVMGGAMDALAGLKVLDFSWMIAGPAITRYMGSHGATIVKIETATRPELFRTFTPMAGGKSGINRCGAFDQHNTDKLSLALNLHKPQAKGIIERLVQWADVVVENFAPGTIKRRGMAYDDLVTIRPDLIMLSLSMQGQTGPHAQQAGFGADLQSLAGFTDFCHWPDRPPSAISIPYTDFVVSWYGIVALLAALEHRQRTGEGQYIDICQLEVSGLLLAPAMMDYLANDRQPAPMGNRSSRAAPHGVYRCRGEDRWCALGVFDDEQWRSFCRAIGDPPWTAEQRFGTFLERKRHEDELDRLVEEWTAQQTAEDVMAKLQAAGVPAGLVATGQDLFEDPQLRHRGHFVLRDHPEMGLHHYEMPSWRLADTPGVIRRPSPCLGEHSEYVCTHLLGLSDEEFVELLANGVIE